DRAEHLGAVALVLAEEVARAGAAARRRVTGVHLEHGDHIHEVAGGDVAAGGHHLVHGHGHGAAAFGHTGGEANVTHLVRDLAGEHLLAGRDRYARDLAHGAVLLLEGEHVAGVRGDLPHFEHALFDLGALLDVPHREHGGHHHHA